MDKTTTQNSRTNIAEMNSLVFNSEITTEWHRGKICNKKEKTGLLVRGWKLENK